MGLLSEVETQLEIAKRRGYMKSWVIKKAS